MRILLTPLGKIGRDARSASSQRPFAPATECPEILSLQGHRSGRILSAHHVLFLLAQGLTFMQIAILEAIYNLTTVPGEIPTGFEQERVCRLPERVVEFSRGGRVGTQLTSKQG